MKQTTNNQPGVKDSSVTLTGTARNAASKEELNREWMSLCEDCEESAWNDCNRCVAKLDRMVEGMTKRVEQLEKESMNNTNDLKLKTWK